MPGDLASMVTPQLIQAVAAKLGMQPQELIAQVQANPQIAQQIMQMMGTEQGATETDGQDWMDKAAGVQAGNTGAAAHGDFFGSKTRTAAGQGVGKFGSGVEAAAPTAEAPPMEKYQ